MHIPSRKKEEQMVVNNSSVVGENGDFLPTQHVLKPAL
jgi:hypothetical protein